MSKLLVFRYRGIAVLCCSVLCCLFESAAAKCFRGHWERSLEIRVSSGKGFGRRSNLLMWRGNPEPESDWKTETVEKKERKNVTTYKINKQPRLKFIGVICSKFLNKFIFLCQVWWYFFWNNHIFNHISSEFCSFSCPVFYACIGQLLLVVDAQGVYRNKSE